MPFCATSALFQDDDLVLAVIAGFILFFLYARLRVGDALRFPVEPYIDGDFVELNAEGTKTMNCLSTRRMKKQPIPIAAPVIGVTGSNWAERWLTVRRGLGLNATLDRALMRDPTPSGGWRRACMFPTEVANWVVYSLKFYGVPVEELDNVGAHSLKATLLMWLQGLDRPKAYMDLLGYHTGPKKGTHREYTRHELSPALRLET